MSKIEDVEFKIVKKYPDELLPGEAIRVTNGQRLSLILCCPQCGKAAGGSHIFNPETNTLEPSIVHDCGWHGFLINGKFSNA